MRFSSLRILKSSFVEGVGAWGFVGFECLDDLFQFVFRDGACVVVRLLFVVGPLFVVVFFSWSLPLRVRTVFLAPMVLAQVRRDEVRMLLWWYWFSFFGFKRVGGWLVLFFSCF